MEIMMKNDQLRASKIFDLEFLTPYSSRKMKKPHQVWDLDTNFYESSSEKKYRCGSTSDKESEIHVISDKNPVFDIDMQ